jgi:threonine/homoserine/homoserine lactone efflux protein
MSDVTSRTKKRLEKLGTGYNITVMFSIEHYWLFLLSGIILNITPSADTMYIITRSIAQGKNVGIVSVLGISTGGLIWTLLTAFGLALILVSSRTAFNTVKYAGALYLVCLGINAFLKHKTLTYSDIHFESTDLLVIYLQGVFTNLLNPKVALFFLSFLPQFINTEQVGGPVPFLILGGTCLTTGTIWCMLLACAASYFTNSIRKNPNISKILQIISGIIFIGLGLNLAFR